MKAKVRRAVALRLAATLLVAPLLVTMAAMHRHPVQLVAKA